MELNHQIRLCRPFPFLFGFRAIRNVRVKCKLWSGLLHQVSPARRASGKPLLKEEHTHRIEVCMSIMSNNDCTI
jgi:hypothetical protein